jgi:hypothetical protein
VGDFHAARCVPTFFEIIEMTERFADEEGRNAIKWVVFNIKPTNS